MFVVLEGMDGCGKSTQSRRLTAWLTEQGREVLLVSDPGSTPVGEAIRSLVKDGELPMQPITQMLLFGAARSELAYCIRQHLKRGGDVVADRWLLSTLAYQHHAGGVPRQAVLDVYELSNYACYPDVYLILDIPPDTSVERLTRAPSDMAQCSPPSRRDRFDHRTVAFKQRLREAYLEEAAALDNSVVIDASCDQDTVYDMICAELELKLAEFAHITE
jgi:dTMP kinase